MNLYLHQDFQEHISLIANTSHDEDYASIYHADLRSSRAAATSPTQKYRDSH